MYGEAYYRALRDIYDAREITAFEHILKKFVTLVSKVENENSDLDDAREISAFLTYFKENHTVAIGNKHEMLIYRGIEGSTIVVNGILIIQIKIFV